MASPSPWRWSWKATNDYKSSFLSIRTIRIRRTRFTTFSLHDDTSCARPHSSTAAKKLKESAKVRSPDNASSILRDEYFTTSKNGIAEANAKKEVSANPVQSSRRRTLSLKSLFGRRSLWRRILFASRKVRSIILLNVLTVIFASNIPVVKEVEAIMDPAAFTVVRFAVSAIPFIPFIFRARGDVQIRNTGIELGFWVSLGYLMQALGLLTSEAGRASFISMFTVIIVPLLDGMLGAIVPARTWFGALMSILGVFLLESSGSSPNVGDLLNFLSAVFFGVHMLRTEHISRRTSKENFLPLLGYEMCVVAFLSTMWYFIGVWFGGYQEDIPSSWTWTMFWDWMVTFPWIPALYTGAFSTGLCLWIEMAAMCDVSATETAIIYGLEPVWGAGFAWFLLGERWDIAGWIGAALVLVGSLTVQIYGSPSSSKSTELEGSSEKSDHLLVSDKKNGLSRSPVVVNSGKDVTDMPQSMAQLCKLELQTSIKSSPERLFDIYKNKTDLMPKISPGKLHSIEVLEGDGKSLGSVRLWTYVMGSPVIAKDKIHAIDEKNNSITFDIIGGDVTKYFTSFKATLHATTSEAGLNTVKWTLEYEKANEIVPTPNSHLDFLLSFSKEIDDYLVKA